MNKETDLGSRWLEAHVLRQQAKNIVLNGGGNLTDELERQMFEEADQRLDQYFKEIKRGDNLAPKSGGNLGYATQLPKKE